ncbi:hypothetical protein V2J09_019249 [Rumex salicifolius]
MIMEIPQQQQEQLEMMNIKEEELSRSVLSSFKSKEEEIERRKILMTEKVLAQLGRVQVETKRLAEIREELEALQDPMRKEVAIVRKRTDTVNRELKLLTLNCHKKEREYNEALAEFNDKSKEKAQLVAKLVELAAESEKLRFKKLEELSESIESLP